MLEEGTDSWGSYRFSRGTLVIVYVLVLRVTVIMFVSSSEYTKRSSLVIITKMWSDLITDRPKVKKLPTIKNKLYRSRKLIGFIVDIVVENHIYLYTSVFCKYV